MKHIEVELKFTLPDQSHLTQRLDALGAEALGQQRQIDTYYNPPHKDFLAGDVVSEWLRLRTETKVDGAVRVSINFKRWLPLGAHEATHCDEFESQLTDGVAVRKLLEALDFTEMTTVDKIRRQWRLGDVIVAVDTVEGLGSFVEFEYAGKADTVEEATGALHRAIDRIGVDLGPRDRRGYPYLLLDRNK